MRVNFLSEGDEISGTDKTILDYWKWAYSSILANTVRGVFAEFLVGSALGVLNMPRVEWDNADINYNGYFIEVKSSAYIQSWKQAKPSRPQYDIAPKRTWTGTGNEYGTEICRFADYYIFCLLKEQNRDKVDPLNIDQWEFYMLPTKVLDHHHKTQKKISLRPLQRLCSGVTYQEIKPTLDKLIDQAE